MNMSEEIEIFVQLLEEGTEVWKPVKAEKLNDGLYTITSINNFNEIWEFNSGQTVKCITKTFADGTSWLVAIGKV
jgi:hypothetical protein